MQWLPTNAEEAGNQRIRVLHVDDDENQLENVKIFLEEGDQSLTVSRVTSGEEALKALSSEPFDCVITDYQMPRMNGIQLVRRIRVSSTVPIIVYTGKGSEEVASEAFEAGADDYIRKELDPSHYQVLAKRVRQAVEKRRAELIYRDLFEHASDAIYIHDTAGLILDINEAGCKRLSYSKEELIGESIRTFVSPPLSRIEEKTRAILREGHAVFKTTNITKDGRLIPVEVSANRITYRGAEAVLVFSRDITERASIEAQTSAKIDALHRHAEELQRAKNVQEVCELTLDTMEKTLGFKFASFQVVREGSLVPIGAKGSPLTPLVMPLTGKGITVLATNERSTVMVNDLRGDKNFVGAATESLSELASPAIVNGNTVAVLNVESLELNAFTPDDQMLLELLAEHVASALNRIAQLDSIRRSEEKYRKLLDSSTDSVILLSGTSIIYANRRAGELHGFSDPAEMEGRDIRDFLPKGEKDRVAKMTLGRQSGESAPQRYEFTILRKDGTTINAETMVSMIDFEGKPVVMSVVRDVSERREYENKLMALHSHAASLNRAATIQEVAEATMDAVNSVMGYQIGSFLIEDGGDLVAVRNIGMKIKGLRIPINGKGITSRAARDARTIIVDDTRLDDGYVPQDAKIRSELAVPVIVDGTTAAVLNVESTEVSGLGELDARILETLAMHVSSAISRMRREAALHDAEARFVAVSEQIDSAMVILEDDEEVSFWNRAAETLLRYGAEEVIGRRLSDLIIPHDDRKRFRDAIKRTLKETAGSLRTPRAEAVRKDGSVIDVSISANTVEHKGSRFIVVVLRDIAGEKAYEEKLLRLNESSARLAEARDVEETYDVTMETMRNVLGFGFGGVAVLDGDTIRYVRSQGNELPPDWKLNIASRSISARAIRTAIPQLVRDTRLDHDYVSAPGVAPRLSELAIPIIVDGRPAGILNVENERPAAFTKSDVGLLNILAGQLSSALERIKRGRQEQEQIRTQSRALLEGADRVGRMVRHDLVGPLQTISNSAFMIRANPSSAGELTKVIEDSVKYATNILEDLRGISNPMKPTLTEMDLRTVVESSLIALSTSSNIKVTKTLTKDTITLHIDAIRMRRAVDNLLKNAVQAMPNGGTLSIEVSRNGSWAELKITDTGVGMSKENLANLFKPFYTTKMVGTGLGLVITKQVIDAHGGTITFDSEEGKGTTATLRLPIPS